MSESVQTPLTVWTLRRGLTVRVQSGIVPLWHGDDVAAALNMVTATSDEHFAVLPGWGDVPFLTTEQVLGLTAFDEQLHGQVEWIASCIAASHAPRRPTVAPRAARLPTPEPIVDDTADTWSIAAAALLLSRDPAISVGREALATFLRDLGLVVRDQSILVPTERAIAAGVLRRNHVWTPRTKVAYNQVRITRVGLQALHERLGGAATLALDSTPTPTLLEV